jgi:voltage-gated potassium channel
MDASAARTGGTRETVRFYLLDHRTRVGKAIDVSLLVLNVVFIGVFVLDTYSVSAATHSILWTVEVGVTGVFLVEYALRVYGAPDRLAEVFSGYTVVDLLSLVPTLALLVAPVAAAGLHIGFLRALRAIRILRFYRFTQDEEFFFGTVSLETLRIAKLLLTVLTVLFVGAGLFYSVEHDANAGVGTFGDAFYYTVITLTTVGFGDIVPATEAGRWVTVGAVLAGVILIPWQASKIVKEWAHKDQRNVRCENCGLAYHDRDASHCKACGHVIYQEFDSRG